MCDIFVKVSGAAEFQSFKGHSAGQKLGINMGSLIVHQLTMNLVLRAMHLKLSFRKDLLYEKVLHHAIFDLATFGSV